MIKKFRDNPVFGLVARITPPPPLIFNQTSFLTLQGILHGSPTLRAYFLALRGKTTLANKRFQRIIKGHHTNFST